ncbi:MAG: 3-deoxy-manno-octulosonate cytidylyltransferase [Helicobacteraceae bacterium]
MIIIPARLASTRFPRKVLADINGMPMVIKTAMAVKDLSTVAIAADSQEVVDVAARYGIKAVLTGAHHASGTDRINEAADILGLSDDELIVNVQADEPFIEASVVKSVFDRLGALSGEFKMVSCAKALETSAVADPNRVKVVLDAFGDAIYFSRSKIPYNREAFDGYFLHLGIYGFDRKSLRQFCRLGASELESTEKLEQLRAIYWGKKIAMVKVKSNSFGIDTPADLEKIKELK